MHNFKRYLNQLLNVWLSYSLSRTVIDQVFDRVAELEALEAARKRQRIDHSTLEDDSDRAYISKPSSLKSLLQTNREIVDAVGTSVRARELVGVREILNEIPNLEDFDHA